MYKELIKKWIPNLTKENIIDYAKKINISLSDSDANTLYQFIMKNYSEILEGNETRFKELKQKINPNLYQQLLKLYEQNKAKYL